MKIIPWNNAFIFLRKKVFVIQHGALPAYNIAPRWVSGHGARMTPISYLHGYEHVQPNWVSFSHQIPRCGLVDVGPILAKKSLEVGPIFKM